MGGRREEGEDEEVEGDKEEKGERLRSIIKGPGKPLKMAPVDKAVPSKARAMLPKIIGRTTLPTKQPAIKVPQAKRLVGFGVEELRGCEFI